jgi:hypothetical protein
MAEITIPAPIDCVWVDDELFGTEDDDRQEVGRVGYWMDGYPRVNPALSGRRPIWVLCPMRSLGYTVAATGDQRAEFTGTPFCIDGLSTAKNQPWDVTVDMASLVVGEKPNITVHPSIHLVGIWHGWLQAGVLHQ